MVIATETSNKWSGDFVICIRPGDCIFLHALVVVVVSHVQLVQPHALYVAYQAPLSMGFPRQDY